jgi:excisionase family DNA binding protein
MARGGYDWQRMEVLTLEKCQTLSRKEAAVALGVSTTTVRRMLDRGQLPWVQVGMRRLILRADLARVLTPKVAQ